MLGTQQHSAKGQRRGTQALLGSLGIPVQQSFELAGSGTTGTKHLGVKARRSLQEWSSSVVSAQLQGCLIAVLLSQHSATHF